LKQDLKDLLATIERVNKQLARQGVSWNIKMFHLREKADVFSEIGDRIISGEVKIDQVKEFLPEYTSAEKFLIQALIWHYHRGDWQKSAALSQKIMAAKFDISVYDRLIIKKSLLYARVLAEEIQDKGSMENLSLQIADFDLKYQL